MLGHFLLCTNAAALQVGFHVPANTVSEHPTHDSTAPLNAYNADFEEPLRCRVRRQTKQQDGFWEDADNLVESDLCRSTPSKLSCQCKCNY